MFENCPKSRIQHCERSELRLHLQSQFQNGLFWRVLKTWILWSNSVTKQVTSNRSKIGGKYQNPKNSNVTFVVIFKQFKMWGIRYPKNPAREILHSTTNLNFGLNPTQSSNSKPASTRFRKKDIISTSFCSV